MWDINAHGTVHSRPAALSNRHREALRRVMVGLNSGVTAQTRSWWSGKGVAAWIVCLLVVPLAAASEGAQSLPRVLLVAADPHTAPSFTTLELEMRRVVAASVRAPVHFDVEHLDS